MTITFTFTEEEFNATLSVLKIFGKFEKEDLEEAKLYWEKIADKELSGEELLNNDQDDAGLRMSLLLAALGTVKISSNK